MLATTHPVPLPLADESDAHASLDKAVQPQPAVVVTVTVWLPPLLVSEMLAGDTEYWHGAAACKTVTVCPPTVTDPVRP
jgi:hypothetical protein